MPERARLVGEAFVHAEEFDAELARLLVKLRRHLVVELEAAAAQARVRMAVPLPRIDLVKPRFAFHLLVKRRPVGLVLDLIPVMIRGDIALTQRAQSAGHLVYVLFAFRHQPARQSGATAGGAFQNFALIVSLLLFRWHAADHGDARFAVKEDLLDEI